MKLALDNCISFRTADKLEVLGNHVVVYHAEHEHDELWFSRAIQKGAEVFISADSDIYCLCNKANKKFIQMPQRMRKKEQLKYLLKELKKFLKADGQKPDPSKLAGG